MPDANQQKNSSGVPMVLVKKPDGTTERVPLDKVMQAKGAPAGETRPVETMAGGGAKQSAASTPPPSGAMDEKKVAASPPLAEPSVPEKIPPSSAKPPQPMAEKKIEKPLPPAVLARSPQQPETEEKKKPEPKTGMVPPPPQQNPPERVPEKVPSTKTPSLPPKQKEAILPMEKKVEEIKSPPPQTERVRPADFSSLLEEPLESAAQSQHLSVLPESRNGIFDRVIAALDFTIPEDLTGRTQSLIQSRVKDVRTDDQVLDYAGRPTSEGGLGFSEDQAGKLVAAIKDAISSPLKKDVPKAAQSAPSVKPEQKKMAPETPRPAQPARPTLHDVTPPPAKPSQTVGPVDELGIMTLTDFRRLNTNVEQAKTLVLEKFKTLKTESYIEYLKGRSAWFSSPLYLLYQGVIMRSINSRQAIDAVIQSEQKEGAITKEEFLRIAEINKALRI